MPIKRTNNPNVICANHALRIHSFQVPVEFVCWAFKSRILSLLVVLLVAAAVFLAFSNSGAVSSSFSCNSCIDCLVSQFVDIPLTECRRMFDCLRLVAFSC